MKLVMLISWWDEPLRNLERAIRDSVSAGCTHVIALDGAYAATPTERPLSSPGQVKHIHKTCRDLNVPCIVEQPTERLTEVQKRTRLFDLGYELGVTSTDWFFVMDADQTIDNPQDIKPYLQAHDGDVISTLIYEHDDKRYDDRTRRRFVRHLFRCVPGLHVGPDNHYTYRDHTGRTLWGLDEVHAPTGPLVLHNRSNSRHGTRNAARNGYYAERTKQNLETTNPISCRHCNKPWVIYTKTGFQLEHLPDGTHELVSTHTEYLCADHAPRAIYENRATAERLAAGDRKALDYLLNLMAQQTYRRPPGDWHTAQRTYLKLPA